MIRLVFIGKALTIPVVILLGVAVPGLPARSHGQAGGQRQFTGRTVGLPSASFACNRPLPAARSGQVVLSGVGYGPYHAGQDPNYGISPSGSEVAADMPTPVRRNELHPHLLVHRAGGGDRAGCRGSAHVRVAGHLARQE